MPETTRTYRVMRFNSSPARMLMRASCVVALWLLSPSLAQAAAAQGQRSSGELCDAHSTTLRKLIRHSKSYGGPLAKRPHRALFGLSDVTARVQRGASANMNVDDAAIQNDAPAANIDVDEGAGPTLHPLGLLVGSLDRQARTQAFTPQSPRAPPSAA
jgi:hypothetical protein